MSLLPKEQLRRILHRGLLAGYWSVEQFNHDLPPHAEFTLPTWDFLDAHPRFADMFFRDLEAYRNRHNNDTPIL
jgi:hypothetical protein